MATKSGVYPVYENQFAVGKTVATTTPIADMEEFSVSIDNNVEEWTPFTTEGWTRRLMTGKSVTISVTGKRNVGDAGNDLIAGLAFKNGRDAETVLKWTFPDGTIVSMDVVVNVTEIGAGTSTAVAPLAFEAMSNGKPTIAGGTSV